MRFLLYWEEAAYCFEAHKFTVSGSKVVKRVENETVEDQNQWGFTVTIWSDLDIIEFTYIDNLDIVDARREQLLKVEFAHNITAEFQLHKFILNGNPVDLLKK